MRTSRFSYANVASTLALVIAMSGGAAYAANTVRSTDIVDGEVKTADIGTSQVRVADIAPNAVGSSEVGSDTIGSAELAADSVGLAELQVGVLPLFTYQSTAFTASDTGATKEVVATCDRTAQSAVTGGGYVISPNISATVVRNYAVSANAWLVRVTSNQATATWQLTAVANCVA